MRAGRRFAVSIMFSLGLTGPASREREARAFPARAGGLSTRGTAGRGTAARKSAARGWLVLRAAVLGLIALIAGASAALVSIAGLTPVAAPALATVASVPRGTLASVVPSTAIPRSRVTFAVYCASAGATSARLLGRTLGLTEHITMRPNPAAGDFTVSVTLPGSIQPGTYRPGIECSDGTSTTARLLVPAFVADGTSGSIATSLTAGGLILIGAGTVTGSIVLRRRRSRHPDLAAQPDVPAQADKTGVSEHSDRFDYSSHSNFRF